MVSCGYGVALLVFFGVIGNEFYVIDKSSAPFGAIGVSCSDDRCI